MAYRKSASWVCGKTMHEERKKEKVLTMASYGWNQHHGWRMRVLAKWGLNYAMNLSVTYGGLQ